MRHLLRLIIVLCILGFGFSVSAKSEFCRGFEEGYKMVKGDNVFVPFCPFEPFTPFGSTPFREGIKAGIKAASK